MGAQGARGRAEELDRRSSRKAFCGTEVGTKRWTPMRGEFAAAQVGTLTGWREYSLAVTGHQDKVRSWFIEQNRLCRPDCDVRRRRSNGSAKKSVRCREGKVSCDLPVFKKTVTEIAPCP